MPNSKQTIIDAIKNFINSNDGNYSAFYVGIAKDPKDRLFNEHKVDESSGIYDYWEAYDDEDARDVEKYCIDTLGTKGGDGGGDESSDNVYAYKTTSDTEEDA